MVSQNPFGNMPINGNINFSPPKRSATPAYEARHAFASNGPYFTTVRVHTKAPTFQYPEHAHFLSFTNGKGNAYARFTLEDLRELITFLQSQESELSRIAQELAPQEQLIESQLAAYQQSMQQLPSPEMIQQYQRLAASVNQNTDDWQSRYPDD